jgi:hypothetical protein
MELQSLYVTSQNSALERILIDQRRAAIAVVERSEAALREIGVNVESAIRTREERRANRASVDTTAPPVLK